MSKKLIFRADGNSITGLGHLYRLFALVEMYKEDYEYIFITREDSVLEVIPSEYPVKIIPNTIKISNEPKWLADHFYPELYVVITDGYQFTSAYQKDIKNLGYFLMFIDDMTTEYMFADIVVNHSPQVKKTNFKSESYTSFALNLKYAILRPQFLKTAIRTPNVLKKKSFFINFGGVDKLNLSLKFLKILLDLNEINSINVLLGAAASNKEIEMLANKHPKIITLHRNLQESELIYLLQSCTHAIVPSSTILFELFCFNINLYSGYFVDNQKEAFLDFKNKEFVKGLGNFTKFNIEEFKLDLDKFINSKNSISLQKQLIDGKQKQRFLKLLKNKL